MWLALTTAAVARGEVQNTSMLIEALKDKDVQVRMEAVEALGRMGAEAKPAIPALIQLLQDTNISAEAAQALASIGRDAIPSLIAAIDVQDVDLQETAICTLALMGSGAADAVGPLTTAFQTHDELSRCTIADALGCIGSPAKAAVPALKSALKSPSANLRLATCMALWEIDRQVDGVVPTLIDLLESRKPQPKTKPSDVAFSVLSHAELAARLLGIIGPEAKSAVPALIKALKNGDRRLRGAAAETLGMIGPDAKAAIPALTAVLGDKDTRQMSTSHNFVDIRGIAGTSLQRMGPNAVACVVSRFHHKDKKVRAIACQVISETGSGGKLYVSYLIEALRDKEPSVRQSAAEALGKLALQPRQVVPALVKKLNDHDPFVRAYACLALGSFRGSAAKAIPALVRVLTDSDSTVRACAAQSLGKIGRKASAAAPELIKLIVDEDSYWSSDSGHLLVRVGEHAIEALGNMGPAAKEAIPSLIELIRWRHKFSKTAIRALERMGPAARSAVPLLIEALPEMSSAATALARIAPDDPRVKAALLENFTAQAGLVFACVEDRLHIALALRRCGPLPSSTASAFAADLDSLDVDRRVLTALALLEIDHSDRRAMQVLADALKQHHSSYVWDDEVADTLSRLGPRGQSLIPILCADLTASVEEVRLQTAARLASLGRYAEPAVPDLVEALIDSDFAQPTVLRSLASIGRPAVRPLIAALNHKDVRVRSGAAQALERIGPDAAEATAALLSALKDPRPDVRAAAAAALASIGSDNAKITPALVPLLNDEYYEVRENARITLEKMIQREYSR